MVRSVTGKHSKGQECNGILGCAASQEGCRQAKVASGLTSAASLGLDLPPSQARLVLLLSWSCLGEGEGVGGGWTINRLLFSDHYCPH